MFTSPGTSHGPFMLMCLFFLRQWRKFSLSYKTLKSFYACTVENIPIGCITVWCRNSTTLNCKALYRVVQSAQNIVGGELPSLQDIYTRWCLRRAWKDHQRLQPPVLWTGLTIRQTLSQCHNPHQQGSYFHRPFDC